MKTENVKIAVLCFFKLKNNRMIETASTNRTIAFDSDIACCELKYK